jgi:hypothetical protein
MPMGHLWDIYGTAMGHLWDIYGTFMGHLWDIYGTSMTLGHLWDIYGTYMGHLWLWDIYGTSMGHLWDIYGTSMGHLWDIYGTSMGHLFIKCYTGLIGFMGHLWLFMGGALLIPILPIVPLHHPHGCTWLNNLEYDKQTQHQREMTEWHRKGDDKGSVLAQHQFTACNQP